MTVGTTRTATRRRCVGGVLGALAALTVHAAALPTAAAQPRPRPVAAGAAGGAGAAAASLRAELAGVQRQQREVAAMLERLTATLSQRRTTPAVNDSLAALVRLHGALGTRAALLEARLRFEQSEVRLRRETVAARQPEGWFGVHVETLTNGEMDPAGATVVHSVEYPKVVSVEPGSPAARAGLVAGDRLLTIAGVDLRRSAFDPRTLQPGRTVPVRIRRDGRTKELQVAITRRPRTFASGVTMRSITVDEPSGGRDGQVRARVHAAPRAPGSEEFVVVQTLPPGAVAVPAGTPMPAPSRTPGNSTVIFYSSPNVTTVAGIEVMRLTPELRATLEVNHGVFVVQVARSSPGERAGLQAGDVLVRANGTVLANPLVFQRVVAEAQGAGTDGVRVELVRGKRTRTVEVNW